MPVDTLVVYQFSRTQVERQDLSHFLGSFAFDKLPQGRPLREMMNSLMFCIHGYDQDPREIHMIPEVRRFYRAFNQEWPYWLYFCNLDQDSLRPMVFSCLDRLSVMHKEGSPVVWVEPDRIEMVKFLRVNFDGMNRVCLRANMFEARIKERSRQIFQYFNLPFE